MSTNVHPAYRAFTVIKHEGKDDFWLAIGAAFKHQSGDGFNIVLQALPIPNGDGQCKIVLQALPIPDRDGQCKLVLRPPKNDEDDRRPEEHAASPDKSGSRRR